MPQPDPNFDPDFASPAQWAAMYRAYGLQVIPCRMPGKRPLLSEWAPLQEKLVSDATFASWYHPTTGEHRNLRNMGIITGRCSDNGYIIDLDTHKNPQAQQWWDGILALHNNAMELETPRQRTGGGGQQLLFRAPVGFTAPTNKTSIGVDIRGQGGFAVFPSSLHESGKSYEWMPGCAPWEIPVLDSPQWLLDEITKLVGAHGGHKGGTHGQRDRVPPSEGAFDAFGNRTDLREDKMFRMVWRVVVKRCRANPIRPTAEQERQIMEEEYTIYERAHGPKETRPGETKLQAMEREQRGPTEWSKKWRRAMAQWDTEVLEAAGKPDPSPDPNDWMKDDLASEFDQQSKTDPKTGKPLPLLQTASQFIAGFVPPSYIVDGILQRGYLYSLTARTNHGKTAVSMYVSQAIARGDKMHGRETEPGTVLMLAGENPDDIRARFLVLSEAYQFDPDKIKMRFLPGAKPLPELLPQIQAEAELIDDLMMVLVDTAAAYFPGDDTNDNAQQGLYARVLRRLTVLRGKPTVLVNCHPIKNAAKDNLLPMGGSAFVNEVDGNLTLWDKGDKHIEMHWLGKFRGPEFEPMVFELRTQSSDRVKDAKGRLMPAIVAHPISDLAVEMGASKRESDENLILQLIHDNPHASFTDLAAKAGFVADGKVQKRRVQYIIDRLKDDKLVERHRGGKYCLTKKGRKEIGVE